jgi:hypothetical protein
VTAKGSVFTRRLAHLGRALIFVSCGVLLVGTYARAEVARSLKGQCVAFWQSSSVVASEEIGRSLLLQKRIAGFVVLA